MKVVYFIVMSLLFAGCTGPITPKNYEAALAACTGELFGGLAWFEQEPFGMRHHRGSLVRATCNRGQVIEVRVKVADTE